MSSRAPQSSSLALAFCLIVSPHLFAADWITGENFRSLPVAPLPHTKPGFSLLSNSITGITFTNLISEQRHLTNQILLNGSGVAAGDVDGDGLTDLYFCGLDAPNALYRNLGNWRFEEIASASGVDCPDLLATGCALADLDGDNDLDLLVNSVGQGTHIYFNNGRARFSKSPTILNQGLGGMSLALGDLDGDGFLDLYVPNYRTLGLMDIPNARATFKTINGKSYVETFNGRPTTNPDLTNRFAVNARGGIEENGEPDFIARNVSGTNFVEFPTRAFVDAAGKALPGELFDWGLAAAIRDINDDHLPDIYVCNDFQSEDRLWLNRGGGMFQLAAPITQRKTSMFSMAVDFADVNRDGHADFFLADMMSRDHSQRMRDLPDAPTIYQIGQIENRPQHSMNMLFLNRGDNTFAEIAQLSRLNATDWTWSCIFIDVDLDGWEDILFSNGMERAARDLDVADRMKAMRAVRRLSDAEIFRARKAFPRLAPPNLAFRNKQDLTFQDLSDEWNFNLPGVTHGMALADLDNDGDLDIALNNLNASAAIYRNESPASRVAVRLKGGAPNTRGINARISVKAEGLPTQTQEMIAGSRYLSSDDPIRSFAAGSASSVSIEVRWRDGSTSQLAGLPPNHIYEVDQSNSSQSPGFVALSNPTLFEDVSALIDHIANEEPFEDFSRQPLLPRKLSQSGPSAAWVDWDSDGYEDLIIGGAKSGTMALYQNSKNGRFNRVQSTLFNAPLKRDVSALIGLRISTPAVFAAFSNYEDALSYGPALQSYSPAADIPAEILPAWDSSAGALAVADIDLDGDLDIFVGGSSRPSQFPVPPSSRLLRNEGGKFIHDKSNEQILSNLALVNSSAFSDVDADGDPDLLLACEWSPIRLFLNEKGAFTDATERFGLGNFKGLWQGIAVGDFDEDGRLDFIASNWGRNSKYANSEKDAARLYSGDFDEDGTYDVIEAHYDEKLSQYVPDRQRGVIGAALQFVNERFRTHAAYSKASVDDLLGESRSKAIILEANRFDSTVFLNRGNRFEARSLPIEAQFAPAFGICVADFDNDSHEDIILAQNFFAVTPETPRHDAGRALLLRGDGKGGFTSVPGHQSGLLVYGEQRSISTADFDHDGRVDLVITQNGAATKLYRNKSQVAGVRVVLVGPPGNPDSIGAMLRRSNAQGGVGPTRLASLTGGYASQNPFPGIIAIPQSGGSLQVSWPDGSKGEVKVLPGEKEVRIHHPAAK